jgi:uncharacterized protein (DUF1684 family)
MKRMVSKVTDFYAWAIQQVCNSFWVGRKTQADNQANLAPFGDQYIDNGVFGKERYSDIDIARASGF